ncbi:DUF924 family protein [Phaeovulum sp. NW3]|uniref:DUF924 family protein n=1 Tax=Phaeovulum sp. NW3 TaxID=2934933 RepID=UPI0020209781|nr:DUF924 family protein [Phaeovulum sp. NW3]MCL7464751.1 DUF924 domain-containing protein [Phaeovulum sp. NW3]
MDHITDILQFWDRIGPEGWYRGDDALDRDIRTRYAGLWEEARDGGLSGWQATAPGALALILLLDQFPRNMFRDHADSFATDARALDEATRAIAAGHDLATDPPLRQFFYLPFMHAEDRAAQDRCIALFAERMPGDNLRHARAHADVIARFGRFPWRNAALGRVTTAAEQAFLDAGGYGAALQRIGPADAGH